VCARCRQRPAAATAAALRLKVWVVLEAEVEREQQVHRLYQCAVTVHWHVQKRAHQLGIGHRVHVLQYDAFCLKCASAVVLLGQGSLHSHAHDLFGWDEGCCCCIPTDHAAKPSRNSLALRHAAQLHARCGAWCMCLPGQLLAAGCCAVQPQAPVATPAQWRSMAQSESPAVGCALFIHLALSMTDSTTVCLAGATCLVCFLWCCC
jgi:hypothetical protein